MMQLLYIGPAALRSQTNPRVSHQLPYETLKLKMQRIEHGSFCMPNMCCTVMIFVPLFCELSFLPFCLPLGKRSSNWHWFLSFVVQTWIAGTKHLSLALSFNWLLWGLLDAGNKAEPKAHASIGTGKKWEEKRRLGCYLGRQGWGDIGSGLSKGICQMWFRFVTTKEGWQLSGTTQLDTKFQVWSLAFPPEGTWMDGDVKTIAWWDLGEATASLSLKKKNWPREADGLVWWKVKVPRFNCQQINVRRKEMWKS